MIKNYDLTGRIFGRLKVIELVKDYDNRKPKLFFWRCICDCGNETIVARGHLTSGDTRSCGCLSKENKSIIGSRRWNKKEPGESSFNALFLSYKRNSLRRKTSFELTKEQFKDLTRKSCFYCGEPPNQEFFNSTKTNGGYTYNGIDRLSSFVGYELDNCVPCCKVCNYAKNTLTKNEFLNWVKRVYDFNFK